MIEWVRRANARTLALVNHNLEQHGGRGCDCQAPETEGCVTEPLSVDPTWIAVERIWCKALLPEGPEVIQRVTSRVIELRAALAETPREERAENHPDTEAYFWDEARLEEIVAKHCSFSDEAAAVRRAAPDIIAAWGRTPREGQAPDSSASEGPCARSIDGELRNPVHPPV